MASRDNWIEFQARSFGASIFALKELAEEGFFHTGSTPVLAFFSLSDDEHAPWLELESARRINPPDLFATFEPEWQICKAQTWGDGEVQGGELAEAFIQAHGGKW